MKRTYQPSRIKRRRSHGFRARMKTAGGPSRALSATSEGPQAAHSDDAIQEALSPAFADERFPKSVRLLKSRDFRRVQRRGRHFRGRYLVVLHLPNDLDRSRIGLAVSKKVGNSVVRNRVKRWLREAIRRQRATLPPVDVVCIARPSAASAGHSALAAEISAAFASVTRSV